MTNMQEITSGSQFARLVREAQKLGLAVWKPHRPDSGGALVALPQNFIVLEENLRIRLARDCDPILSTAVPVAWCWQALESERGGIPLVLASCCPSKRKKAPAKKSSKKRKPAKKKKKRAAK